MRLEDALTEFAYTKDHSPESRRWYKSRLTAFIAWCHQQGTTEVEGLSTHLVRRYIDYRRNTPSVKGTILDSHTLHGHARALRTFLYWAVREELLSEKTVKRLEMPKKEQKVLHVLSQQEIESLYAACALSHDSDTVARNRAIVAVLLDTGMRAAELCGLTLDAVVFTPDEAYCTVRGKGRKQREVGMGNQSRRLLHRYIHRHRHAPAGEKHVFLGRKGQMTPSGIDQLLYRLRDAAGIDAPKVSAHTFRHTYAVRYLEHGGDVYKLSRLLGHESVQTTENYLKAFSAKAARQGSSVFDIMRG